jgi:hypothetical protein
MGHARDLSERSKGALVPNLNGQRKVCCYVLEMQKLWSTEAVELRDRLSYWVEAV